MEVVAKKKTWLIGVAKKKNRRGENTRKQEREKEENDATAFALRLPAHAIHHVCERTSERMMSS